MESHKLYTVSYFILIGGIIASVIAGFMVKSYSFNYVLEDVEEHINWALIIGGIFSSVILHIILSALATILRKVEMLEYKIEKALPNNKNTNTSEHNEPAE